jgi:hypothetical protein
MIEVTAARLLIVITYEIVSVVDGGPMTGLGIVR